MANAVTYQCPNCNGVLAFNAVSGRLECAYCGGSFNEGEIEQDLPIDSSVTAQEAQHVKTVAQFLDNAPWAIGLEGTAAAKKTIRYSCPSCGADIVADQSTVSTSCPYCGNNMFVAGIATEDTIPQWILPFSITRAQAEARMREHFRHKWYLPRQFKAQLAHMQAIYVPYYLYDIKVKGWADYIANIKVSTGDNSSCSYYAYKRAGKATFSPIPIDGSSKMPDAHMDSIAPFSFTDMRAFSLEYAAGYLMEVPDESAEMCQPRAERLARTSFETGLMLDVLDEPKITGIEQFVGHETDVSTVRISSCVLPVWLMHCTWEGRQMLFAVNGETGKCIGDLPISGARRALTIAPIVLVLVVAAFLVFSVITDNWHDMRFASKFIAPAIAGVAVIPLAVDSHFKRQMRTAVEAPNADESYTSKGLVITRRWRSEKCYGSAKKALQALEEKNASEPKADARAAE